jgi:hypothetical protein
MQEHHSAQNRKQHQRPIFYSHLDMPQLFKGGGDGSSVIFGIKIYFTHPRRKIASIY